jgi:hypothetical protein
MALLYLKEHENYFKNKVSFSNLYIKDNEIFIVLDDISFKRYYDEDVKQINSKFNIQVYVGNQKTFNKIYKGWESFDHFLAKEWIKDHRDLIIKEGNCLKIFMTTRSGNPEIVFLANDTSEKILFWSLILDKLHYYNINGGSVLDKSKDRISELTEHWGWHNF